MVNKNYNSLNIPQIDKSIYSTKRAFPDEVSSIKRLVLKEPKSGFPSIFKIKEKRSQLFVTAEAKIVLESAGIKGCIFEEVEVSS